MKNGQMKVERIWLWGKWNVGSIWCFKCNF